MVLKPTLAAKIAELGFRPSISGGSPGSVISGDGTEAIATPTGSVSSFRLVARCRLSNEGCNMCNFVADACCRDRLLIRPNTGCLEGQRPVLCHAFLDPNASQEDVFAEVSPVVEDVLQSKGDGAVICFGAEYSGKTYTLNGKATTDDLSEGLVQRTARRIFERARNEIGGTFTVDVSFLQAGGADYDHCFDLLGQDAISFPLQHGRGEVWKRLERVTANCPDDICKSFLSGMQLANDLKELNPTYCAFSDKMFSLIVKRTASSPRNCSPHESRLVFADVASLTGRAVCPLGSLTSPTNETIAAGETSNPASPTDTLFLAPVLQGCLEVSSKLVAIAHVNSDVGSLETSMRTLRLGQQLEKHGKFRSRSERPPTPVDNKALQNMRQRHTFILRMLEEKLQHVAAKEQDTTTSLQKELDDLAQQLLEKNTLDSKLDCMRGEQAAGIEHIHSDLGNLISKVQHQVEDLASQQQRFHDGQESKIKRLETKLSEALAAQEKAEHEVSELRVRHASAEERGKTLQQQIEKTRQECLASVQMAAQSVADRDREVSEMRFEIQRLKTGLTTSEEQVNMLNQSGTDAAKEIGFLTSKLRDAEQRETELLSKLRDAEQRETELLSMLEDIQASIISTAPQALGDVHSREVSCSGSEAQVDHAIGATSPSSSS